MIRVLGLLLGTGLISLHSIGAVGAVHVHQLDHIMDHDVHDTECRRITLERNIGIMLGKLAEKDRRPYHKVN